MWLNIIQFNCFLERIFYFFTCDKMCSVFLKLLVYTFGEKLYRNVAMTLLTISLFTFYYLLCHYLLFYHSLLEFTNTVTLFDTELFQCKDTLCRAPEKGRFKAVQLWKFCKYLITKQIKLFSKEVFYQASRIILEL